MNEIELRQAAAEIAALDAKRTPGEWRQPEGEHLSRYVEHVSQPDPITPSCKLTIAECIVRHPQAHGARSADAGFIAAAPRMASLIAAQAERIRQLEERVQRLSLIPRLEETWNQMREEAASLRATIASQAAELSLHRGAIAEALKRWPYNESAQWIAFATATLATITETDIAAIAAEGRQG